MTVVAVEDVDGRSEEEDEDAIVRVTQTKTSTTNGRSHSACNLAEVAILMPTSQNQNDALPKRVLSETRSLPSRRLPHSPPPNLTSPHSSTNPS